MDDYLLFNFSSAPTVYSYQDAGQLRAYHDKETRFLPNLTTDPNPSSVTAARHVLSSVQDLPGTPPTPPLFHGKGKKSSAFFDIDGIRYCNNRLIYRTVYYTTRCPLLIPRYCLCMESNPGPIYCMLSIYQQIRPLGCEKKGLKLSCVTVMY